MRKRTVLTLLVLVAGGAASLWLLVQWGFWGHRHINYYAVFTLPKEMLVFYKAHHEYIREQGPAPDRRRYIDPNEAPRHYIDLDRYGKYPNFNIPRTWDSAYAMYGDQLYEHGILPWTIERWYYKLVDAFRRQDASAILRYSADLGHYVADAHVPLHTTENYNGQLTGQRGIHALWESRIPETFGANYNPFVGPAEYIEDPLEMAWTIILESHRRVDSVLMLERRATELCNEGCKFVYSSRGSRQFRTYSRRFIEIYDSLLNGMVERRYRQAIKRVGSYWYSAWVDAGKPDLSVLAGVRVKVPKEKRERKSFWHVLARLFRKQEKTIVQAPKGHVDE